MKQRAVFISCSLLSLLFLFSGILYAEGVPVPDNASVAPANPIHIVTPDENLHLPAISATFVCGSVPEGGKLAINGVPVPVSPGGGFVAMVQLLPGTFQIKAEYQLADTTYHLTRTVFVAAPEQPVPASPLTIVAVTPKLDQELLAGDLVEVTCKGSPGMRAYFTVKGIRRRFPMAESAGTGLYHGVYQVGQKDRLRKSHLKVTLVDPQSRQRTAKEADGTLSLFPHVVPVMAETVSSDVVLRSGPSLAPDDKAGYLMFPPLGTLLQITGSIGNEYRVRLTKTRTVWVGADQVKRLPAGTSPAHVMVGGIRVCADGNSTLIRIPLGRKIPFQIDPDTAGKYLDLSLYGAYSNTDLISNPSCGVVENVRWFQDDEETYRLRVYTAPNGWWGYDARYEGSDLVLELRTPPPIPAGDRGVSPLAGLTIAVDAGHGAGGGAMGVTGYAEGDANMAMALNLKDKLLALGARVVMTRTGDIDVPLTDRTKIAWQNRADLLISLHNNSLGYGGNPLLKHGFGVYYFQPQSLPLAKAVHTAYQDIFRPGAAFSLPDDGLYYDNLALTRPTQMPSILIESAYMILPAEEADLKTDDFRSACSAAIIRGLESYVASIRPAAGK